MATTSNSTQSVKCPKSWSVTKMEGEHFEFLWTLKNYKLLSEQKKLTTLFKGGPVNSHEWQLILVPKRTIDGEDYVSLFVSLLKIASSMPKGQEEIEAHFEVTILDQFDAVRVKRKFANCRKVKVGVGFGWEKFCRASDLMNICLLASVEDLKVHCKVWLPGDVKTTNGQSECEPAADHHLLSLSQSFLSLLDNDEFSDITVVTKTKTYRAHKSILSARSPVFHAMFRSNMVEALQNSVQIEDFDDDVVKSMLEFLYSGKTLALINKAPELLQIADKYEILGLKQDCEHIMIDNLTVENAAEFMILANRHNTVKLKRAVISFMTCFKTQIQKTVSFKRLAASSDAAAVFLDIFLEVIGSEEEDAIKGRKRRNGTGGHDSAKKRIRSSNRDDDDSSSSEI